MAPSILRLELNILPPIDYRSALTGAIGGDALAPASFVLATPELGQFNLKRVLPRDMDIHHLNWIYSFQMVNCLCPCWVYYLNY